MTPSEQKAIHKAAIKEAIEEWLDKQFITVGKWTVKGLAAISLVAILWVYAASQGWNIKL